MERQIRYSGKIVLLVPFITELTQTFCRLGEDKASDGLLGAIGLGKRSIYSLKLVRIPSFQSILHYVYILRIRFSCIVFIC